MQYSTLLSKLAPGGMRGAAARLGRRIARRVQGPRTQLTLFALAVAAGLQALGRWWAHDEVDDAVAATAALLLVWRALGISNTRLRPARVLLRRLARTARRSVVDSIQKRLANYGVDFVEDVPYPRAVPPLLRFQLVLGVGLAAVSMARPWGDGFALVEFARTWVYPAYLLLVSVYWSACLCLGLAGLIGVPFVAANLVHQSIRRGDERRHIAARRAIIAALVLMAVVTALLPAVWAIRAALLIPIVISIPITLTFLPRLTILWHSPKSDPRIRSIDIRGLLTIELILCAAIPLFFATIPGRAALDERMFEVAQVSAMARWVAALASFWIVVGLSAYRIHFVLTAALDTPSRPQPRRAALRTSDRGELALATGLLESNGWNVLAPDSRGRVQRARPDVTVRLDPEATLDSPLLVDLNHPLPARSLENPEILWVLERRAVIAYRRRIFKGTEAVFRDAAGSQRGPGSGYLYAPHQWMLRGLARDNAEYDDSDDRTIDGFLCPNYRAVMPLPARHHLWVVLTALGIDLIHITDSVGFRKLRLVLTVIFQVYDRTSGTRPLLESDLTGVHGVHAVIHDIRPDAPREDDVYPEPEFASITRARVLHLYRDRGGQEELDPIVPEDSDRPVPVPVGSGWSG